METIEVLLKSIRKLVLGTISVGVLSLIVGVLIILYPDLLGILVGILLVVSGLIWIGIAIRLNKFSKIKIKV